MILHSELVDDREAVFKYARELNSKGTGMKEDVYILCNIETYRFYEKYTDDEKWILAYIIKNLYHGNDLNLSIRRTAYIVGHLLGLNNLSPAELKEEFDNNYNELLEAFIDFHYYDLKN